jgi:pyruvate dehydrogenase E2 component (dihydrolipoamide acetyltransferase)
MLRMRLEVKLPNLGKDAPNEAKLSFWFFEKGETVKEGEDLVEMVTDKATFQVPSPATGRLIEIRFGENQKVKVGDVMAVLET